MSNDANPDTTPDGDGGPGYGVHVALSLFIGILTLLLCVSGKLLQDPDTYSHIAIGARMLQTGSIPRVDEFSHTFAGHPWISTEWLAEILFAGAATLAGWRGVALLSATTAAASFAWMFLWLTRRLQPTVALGVTLLALTICATGISARPKVFFIPLLLVWTTTLIDAGHRRTSPPLWLAGMLALWSNLHPSANAALPIAAFLGLEAILTAPPAQRARSFRDWCLFGVLGVAALGATPYGYETLLNSLNLITANESIAYLDEWQPLHPGLTALIPIAALTGCAVLLGSAPRRYGFRLLLVLACGIEMILHRRFSGLFTIVAVACVADPLAHRFPSCRPRVPAMDSRTRLAFRTGLAALAAGCVAIAALSRPSPSAAITPTAALEAAERAGVAGNVFNDYDFGGYLIWRGVKTFVDGRSDQLFINGFMTAITEATARETPDDFFSILDRYHVTWALVKPGSEEAAKLDNARDRGWRCLHRDGVAAVYVKENRGG